MTSSPPREAVEPASRVLQQLNADAPAETFTLGWLLSRLGTRSFGMIMLLLAIAAIAPGISFVAGLVLMIPAFQLTMKRPAPIFPKRISDRPLKTKYLAALTRRAMPVLIFLERAIHPRWFGVIRTGGRPVGVLIMLLNAALIAIPIPFSNILPALLIALIALAFLEEDGFLLILSFLLALVALAAGLMLGWGAIVSAGWLVSVW